MNDTHTNTRLFPTQIITIYNSKSRSHYYLEHREIKDVKGKPVLMAPVPMPDSVFKSIAESFLKSNVSEMHYGSLIPEHMLYGYNKLGKTVVMWWRPAMKRVLNFSSALGIKGDSNVHLPATLYLVINTKLYVFALMDSVRPTERTRLYHAPFFNIYAEGNVCLGTAPIGKTKARTFVGEAERFERGFYMAEQNGVQGQQCKTPLRQLWPELIKKKKPFPCGKELVQHPTYKTLGDLITKLIGKEVSDYE